MDATQTRTLVKDGRWLVPEEDRPKNWRDMGLLEPEAAVTSPVVNPAEPPSIPPEVHYPMPPAQFKEVFLPIFQGIERGLQARQQLLALSSYCLQLEIFLSEQDIKRGASLSDPKSGRA